VGRKVERLAEIRAAGEQPDESLRKWCEQLPPRLRSKLAKFGVLDGCAIESAKPLLTHLADFRQALRDKATTETHIQKTCNRIETLIRDSGIETVRTLTETAVARYLAERRGKPREKGGLSSKSSNHYLGAIKSFCNWLVSSGRASAN